MTQNHYTDQKNEKHASLVSQMLSHRKETSLLWQDGVKAAKVPQDNSRRWRSWVSTGHVLLISVFYGNVFQERKRSRVICSIQQYSLLFTTPLTIWQGLYSSLFYAKEKWKIPAWIRSYARIVMVLNCWACLLTSVHGGKIERITN